jgi:3'-phosphoadenosine 5'-phosphosulfate sulfotransferase (PAPS reductase)/FAD synthetase
LTPIEIIDSAVQQFQPSHVFAMFSGGHDSLTSTHLAAQHPSFSGAVHINTGIGIEETRDFVRDTCRSQGWPLLEYTPDGQSWEDICLKGGMPGGPAQHDITYYWLKQRSIRRLVREHKQGLHGRIGLVTGIRTEESQRRMTSVMAKPVHRIGAQVWINPILEWTAVECGRYIEAAGLKRSEVVNRLHRSGECLCGSLSHHSELEEIAFWYPKVAQRIRAMEQECFRRDLPSRWGGAQRLVLPPKEQDWLPLCQSCETRWEREEVA